MPRATKAPASRKRRKKFLKAARGYWGARSKLYRTARESVNRARAYAYRDRRTRKREFRRLWIVRINAAARQSGLSYSRFMNGIKAAGLELDRKVLADLAVTDAEAFASLAKLAKEVLP